jgi:DNA-binding sugar fermentation-stimulating protein
MIIHRFKNTIKGIVINRPSKTNKSPYLADVLINNKIYMAHSPSLGLSGLIKPGSIVYLESNPNPNNVSQYRIVTVKIKEFETNNKFIYVGANPVLVNQLFLNCLKLKLIKFNNIVKIKQEVNIFGSRIDFEIIDKKNQKYLVECKYAPTVDYHPDHKPIKNVSVGNKTNYKRAAIFPDGWQYKKGAVVSERALKHLNTLITGVKKGYKCYNFYFCLREDVKYFRPNYEKDIIFTQKFKEAIEKGVIIKAFKLKYTKNNIKFLKEIPIKLF